MARNRSESPDWSQRPPKRAKTTARPVANPSTSEATAHLSWCENRLTKPHLLPEDRAAYETFVSGHRKGWVEDPNESLVLGRTRRGTKRLENLPRPLQGTDSLAARPPSIERVVAPPAMPSFVTSAPGKVIVFGEHAVVYGKSALAASISLRSYLHVTPLPTSQQTITLRFPDIGLEHTWNIDELPWAAFKDPQKKKNFSDIVTVLDADLVKAIDPCLKGVCLKAPSETMTTVFHQAALSFLYQFLSLRSQGCPGCVYTLRSTVPIGAGLGSSASISVCISSALLFQIGALDGPRANQPTKEAQADIEAINRWAFVGELCIHKHPSGVDNTVSTRGKAVMFKRVYYDDTPPTVTPLQDFPELPLLLVNTKQARSTAAEVAKVRALRQSQPVLTDRLLDAIDNISESAHNLIATPTTTGRTLDPQALEALGTLINVNHGLLVALGVSHPRLERIRELVEDGGLGWTKLTGAGGGGCAITLLRADAPAGKLRELEEKLDGEGFERFETTLGGDGVGVLFPAVMRDGADGGEGGEMDPDALLEAEGREGVERLVGVGGQEEGRQGWKFWR